MKINHYSLLKSVVLVFIATAIGFNASAQYCTAYAFSGCNSSGKISIQSVRTTGGINNFTNNNTHCANTTTGYSDYTSMKVTQEANKKIDLVVTLSNQAVIGQGNTRLMVWVDWGRDGSFAEPGDEIPDLLSNRLFGGPGSSLTVDIDVPGYAKQGDTRMRIAIGSTLLTFDPNMTHCGPNTNHGEIEDYTFEVINPCLPPDVISVSNVDYKSADLAWTPKLNAELYEYLIKTTPDTPTGLGYTYTKDNTVEVDTFQCDTKYYMFVRLVCDSAGIGPNWARSAWAVDSFETHPCCYDPVVSIKNITSTTAVASWDAIQSAYGYEYAVSTTKIPPQQGTYTTSTTVLLQGLKPKTTHYLHVRSRCNPTPLSGWSQQALKTLQYASVNSVYGSGVFTMDVYPNPMQDKLNIELNGERSDNAQLTILDLTGKVVYAAPVTSDNVSVNTDNLTAGIYIVKYTDDTHNEVMKVTKK